MSTKNVIIHGDSRDMIPRISTPINCVLTDPPYGMDFQSNNTRLPESKKYSQKIEADGDPVAAVDLFHSVMGPIIPKMADQCEIYVFTAWHLLELWIPAVKDLNWLHPAGPYTAEEGNRNFVIDKFDDEPDHGITLKQMLIWDKGYPGLGDLEANWGCGHEIILYLKKGRRPIPKRRSGIIHVDKIPSGKNIHPTEKPVALLKELILMSTDPGDLIVDPFSGSGSTSVAAMECGRNSLAFEIDEQYIEPSRARLAQGGLFS